MTLSLEPIGRITARDGQVTIDITPRLRAGLVGLADFSHVHVLWCFDPAPPGATTTLSIDPYPGVSSLGVFATRSPLRPNPIALSTARITGIDVGVGKVQLAHLDARDASPVIDLKPYSPSIDRVAHPTVPDWCAHWPQSLEESASFDWSMVFAAD